jgi:glycosyltransferase involved in cell wall biosynthesis
MSPEISVLLPMFNEEDVLEETLAVVCAEVEKATDSFEILCINDGSTDRTGALLGRAAAADPRVLPLELSRNFGKEAAMAAGLDHARGQAVLILDADLQHPAQLVSQMVKAWRDGADVVSGVKESRGKEGLAYGLMARGFNALMGTATREGDFRGSSDFKLLDRQVVEALKACPERHRFFRGLVAWVGFRTVDIPFHVQERAGGTTKWSTTALIRYSLRNLLSFSALPLRLIAVTGFSMLVFSALMGAWTMYRYVRGDALSGFPTVILLQLILGGLLLTSLGVISLYLAEMFEEIKRRPIYLYRAPRGQNSRTEE